VVAAAALRCHPDFAAVADRWQALALYAAGEGTPRRLTATHGGPDEEERAAVLAALGSGQLATYGAWTALPLHYERLVVGAICVSGESRDAARDSQLVRLGKQLAPTLVGAQSESVWARNLRVLQWIAEARDLAPGLCDWVGIYYRGSYLLGETGTDLVIGPYIGEPTTHVRIPIDRGLCGLALREGQVVNVDDVRADSRFIACSLSTRSELVVPLAGTDGRHVAELDIDSDTAAAFDDALAARITRHAGTFAQRCL